MIIFSSIKTAQKICVFSHLESREGGRRAEIERHICPFRDEVDVLPRGELVRAGAEISNLGASGSVKRVRGAAA